MHDAPNAPTDCPDCGLLDATGRPLTRRRFLGRVGALAAAAFAPVEMAALADAARKPAATHHQALFKRLMTDQPRLLQRITHSVGGSMLHEGLPGWAVSKVRVGDLGRPARNLVVESLREHCTRDAYRRFRRQMREDSGGIDNYSVAFIGQPGHPRFQLIVAGRHFTMRMDDGTDDSAAFGGPVVYGHDEANHRAEYNLWYHHMTSMTRVARQLEGAHRKAALVPGSPPHEFTVMVRPDRHRQGVRLSALDDGQRKAIVKVVRTLFAEMYGETELARIDRVVRRNGGWGLLQLAFYRDVDKHDDGVWDVWRMEGPGFLWYFRGNPHVHAYINIHRKPD